MDFIFSDLVQFGCVTELDLGCADCAPSSDPHERLRRIDVGTLKASRETKGCHAAVQ